MGADSKKKPPLPAPTDTESTAGFSELAPTDLSRATDKTSWSVPEDGSPITISTRRKREKDGDAKISHGSHPSQTSLLIEYFEGSKEGKSDSRRPSVRVRVTPSSHKKSKSSTNDHIQITESKGSRKPSYTKHITLGNFKDDSDAYEKSLSEATGSNVTSNGGGPIDIEVRPRRHGSPLIPAEPHQSNYMQDQNASDISSLPANSFLDGGARSQSPRRKRSKSKSHGEALAAGAAAGLATAVIADTLKTPTRSGSRSRSKDRITQKAIEKIKNEHHSEKRRRHSSKSRAHSASGDKEDEGSRTPRRRSSRNHNFEESLVSGTDSSLLSSQPAPSHRSFQSGTSKSSLNNPKLLETVEDAIRRLIIPELKDLKERQIKNEERENQRRTSNGESRSSIASGSGVSRESREERSGTPKVTVNGKEVSEHDSLKSRKEGTSGRGSSASTERNFERGASEETVTPGGDRKNRSSSERHRGIEALVAGGAIGALTAAALHNHDSKESLESTRERRRRRTTRGVHTPVESSEGKPTVPMPMMSEINDSDLTRTSIQSAETDRPRSGDEELRTPIHEVSRGQTVHSWGAGPSDSYSPPESPYTPTRTPVGIRQGLGTQHTNYSRGDLSLRNRDSREEFGKQKYEINASGRKVPVHHDEERHDEPNERNSYSHAAEAGLAGAAAGAGLSSLHHYNDDDSNTQSPMYYGQSQWSQEVPPPLRYVPYAEENRRGLSPIQSVSSWREDEMNRSVRSYTSSLDKQSQQQRDSVLSYNSLESARLAESQQQRDSVLSYNSLESARLEEERNRHDFSEVREGGLADSELTQDTEEYLAEQRAMDDRDSEAHHGSYRGSDAYSDRVSPGQNVRGGAGANVHVHTPVGVESAVASLVDASVLTGGSNQSGQSGQQRQSDRRASYASFEEGSERNFTSRGNSPEKQDHYYASGHQETRSPGSDNQRGSPNEYDAEYELDNDGRKVTMPSYRRSNLMEAGVIGAAAGMAAGAIAGRKDHGTNQERREHDMDDYGTPQNKSFKERAMENIALAQNGSPPRSVGKSAEGEEHVPIKMSASGIPDVHSPMPEIGYGDEASEVTTNPSVIHGPGVMPHMESQTREVNDQDEEWRRTSAERKRDTLVTNPYEDMPGPNDRSERVQHEDFGFNKVNSPPGAMKDEGYMSSAPNGRSPDARTPDQRQKGVGVQNRGGLGEPSGGHAPYTPDHSRHLSNMSEGLGSPLYDGSTGNGVDRIQNNDVRALMEHLTVRDAQRSARDTEILITLVQAVTENRNHGGDVVNHLEELKRLLADTEDVIITEVQRNTDKSIQKGMGGVRPLPSSAPQSFKSDPDNPAKRKNVFKRALRSLGMKSTNDLGRIEDIMHQILADVEDLKKVQGISQHTQQASSRPESYNDMPEGAYEQDRGYEPEGHAGTSTASHASQSGQFSNPHSRGTSAVRGFDVRKDFSDHRISTVPEGDEDEIDLHEQTILNNQFENNEELLTPTREIPRGGSVPLNSPPQVYLAQAPNSTENTPKTEKAKKHKSSSSSSWIPKFKSRWSETTASSVAKGFRSNRSSKQKEDYRPASKSGSDVASLDAQDNAPTWNYQESDKLHSGFSQVDILRNDENAPLDPLFPAEDPKYKAHRNSVNLQHPQPRPGPTLRYQTALEVQAQDYGHPQSPKSVDWGSNTSLNRLPQPQINRYSNGTGNLSPISDGPYSPPGSVHEQSLPGSMAPPPRPPKEPLNSSPELQSKSRNKLSKPSPLKEQVSVSPDYDNSPLGSPRSTARRPSALGGVPPRKPTGPRSMSTASKSGGDLDRDNGTVIRKPINRDTFGTIASHHSGEDEIF